MVLVLAEVLKQAGRMRVLLRHVPGLRRVPPVNSLTFPSGTAQRTRRVPSTRAVFEALTCKACEEGFSYERMETMGDAVLKFETRCHPQCAGTPSSREGLRPCAEGSLSRQHQVTCGPVAMVGSRSRFCVLLVLPCCCMRGNEHVSASQGCLLDRSTMLIVVERVYPAP